MNTRMVGSSRSHVSLLRGCRIGVIGAGKMGQALLQGLIAQGVSRAALCAADPRPVARRAVSRRFHLRAARANPDVARRSDIVILAVKPQQFPELLQGLAPHLGRSHLVISIAAGITIRWLEQRLPGAPVIRAMPNLAATVGCGFSALAAGRRASARHRALAAAIFRAVGEVVELPERCFDAVTAVSGSGPAYVFVLAQAWEEAARSLGLPSRVAAAAIRRTLAGSVRLLEASRETPQALAQKVASKGGTTEAALKTLARHRVPAHIAEAIRAAAHRSKELSWI